MTHGSEPRDPWRKDGDEPTAVQPVPGPFPAPPYPSEPYQQPYQPGPAAGWGNPPTPYPAADPNAPAWARQAHAQGAYEPAPPPAGGHIQPMFPPTVQQQPFQQPGYAPPGYPPGAFARNGYPPPYPPGGYPPGMYPGAPRGPMKPGVVTGAAVLAFVQAGLLVIAGIITLSGVSALQSLDFGVGRDFSTVLTVMGVLTLVAAGLLVAGGVMVHNRRPLALIVGCGLSLLLSVWWMVQFDVLGVSFFWALLLAAMPIISLSLILGTAARTWAKNGPAAR